MPRMLLLRSDGAEFPVTTSEGQVTVGDGEPIAARPGPGGIVHIGEGTRRTAWVAMAGDVRWVYLDGRVWTFEAVQPGSRHRTAGHHGTLAAPMPATVIKVEAAPGDSVARGAVLVVLEAMKMEMPIKAPYDGVISAVNCRPGDLVQPGVGLIEIDEVSSEGSSPSR
jgi:3-methylcrotonyl-CoA carboxylase alpha subunit